MSLNPTTLQSLILTVRQRTDTVNNTGYVSDAEITGYLNNDLCVLDGVLISKFNDYKITKVIMSVNAGTNYITVPLDFLKLRGVDVWFNNQAADGYITMQEYSWEHRNKKIYPNGGQVSLVFPYCLEYRLEGQNINILPPEIANNYQYRVNYSPDYIPLVYPTDTLQTYMDSQAWCEYAICKSAAKICQKQDLTDTASLFLSQAMELKEHIQKLSAPNRNSGEPKAMSSGGREGDWGIVGGYGTGWW